jgi:hypothetical protein
MEGPETKCMTLAMATPGATSMPASYDVAMKGGYKELFLGHCQPGTGKPDCDFSGSALGGR